MAHATDLDDFFTPAEVAKRLKVSRWTVYRAVEDGGLPAVRLGKCIRIPRCSLDAYLKDHGNAIASTDVVNKILNDMEDIP